MLFRAFRKHSKALYMFCLSKSLFFTWFPFGNPCQKNGFPTVFLGVPESWKASNFAPCRVGASEICLPIKLCDPPSGSRENDVAPLDPVGKLLSPLLPLGIGLGHSNIDVIQYIEEGVWGLAPR